MPSTEANAHITVVRAYDANHIESLMVPQGRPISSFANAFNGHIVTSNNSFDKLSHYEIQTHHHGKVDNGSQEVGSVSHARVIVPE